MRTIFSALMFCVFLLSACQKQAESLDSSPISPKIETPRIPQNIAETITKLEPFFKPMGKPKPDEWLATFPEEGQTFEQYFVSNPNIPSEVRSVIYVQPLGKFKADQRAIVGLTAEFLGLFYGLPVKVLPDLRVKDPLSLEDYRIHPSWKTKQIRTGYVMDKVLKPILPKDAIVLLALTNEDLYPDKTFSFVFGQASLQERVGVFSLFQLEDKKDFKHSLSRMLKISTHETGHIFSMAHCTKYECLMSGTNHLGETDSRPLDSCPECTAKILWMKEQDAVARYKNLAVFCERNSLKSDAEGFQKKASAIYSGDKR
jgi:archaemetzincin